MSLPATSRAAFAARRSALLGRLKGPALLLSGLPRARNFPANLYPHRASSHFLYFVGDASPNAALLFADGGAKLFVEPPDPDDALWHGPRPALSELEAAHGLPVVSIG